MRNKCFENSGCVFVYIIHYTHIYNRLSESAVFPVILLIFLILYAEFFKLEFFNNQTRYYITLQQFTKLDESIDIYYARYIYFINLCRYIDTS